VIPSFGQNGLARLVEGDRPAADCQRDGPLIAGMRTPAAERLVARAVVFLPLGSPLVNRFLAVRLAGMLVAPYAISNRRTDGSQAQPVPGPRLWDAVGTRFDPGWV